MATYSERIRELRILHEMSQQDLADRLDVNKVTVMPSLIRLQRWSRKLLIRSNFRSNLPLDIGTFQIKSTPQTP